MKFAKNILFIGMLLNFVSAHAVTKSRYEELELFNKVLYLIESQYYRSVDTNKLVEGAIKGMMDTLDPHSAFLSKEFFKKKINNLLEVSIGHALITESLLLGLEPVIKSYLQKLS